MQLQEHKKVYVQDDEIFSFQDTLLDNINNKLGKDTVYKASFIDKDK